MHYATEIGIVYSFIVLIIKQMTVDINAQFRADLDTSTDNLLLSQQRALKYLALIRKIVHI